MAKNEKLLVKNHVEVVKLADDMLNMNIPLSGFIDAKVDKDTGKVKETHVLVYDSLDLVRPSDSRILKVSVTVLYK